MTLLNNKIRRHTQTTLPLLQKKNKKNERKNGYNVFATAICLLRDIFLEEVYYVNVEIDWFKG